MGTIYYGDAEVLEKSFSFNCNDHFNNFSHNPMVVLMSDDEDDDESYIEIAIAPTSTTDEDEDEEEEAMEFQFRISFSSAPSFPPLLSSQCSKNSPDTDSSSSSTLSSSTSNLFSSSSSTSTTASMSSEWDGASQKPNPPVPSNVQKTFVSSLKESWEIGDTKDCLYESPQSAIRSSKTNWGLIQSRKTSKVMTVINYGIMKFFVKFRSVKLQSMLSSAVKKSQKVTVPQGNIIRHSTGTCQRDQKQRSNIKNYFGIGDRSRVAEINLDAIKGIIDDAMGVMSIGRRKDRQPKRKSCPSSIKSSPIHQGSVSSEGCKIYTTEHSIQAAIAHCKRSSGVTSDSCAQGFPKA